MNADHLLEAIRQTAHQIAGERPHNLVLEALRGIVARAERYEAIEKHEAEVRRQQAITSIP